jgi:hypothetical protein
MEEAPENGKESSHSAHASGINECREIKGNSLLGMAVEQLLGRPVSKQRGMHMWRETELFIRQFVFLVPQLSVY